MPSGSRLSVERNNEHIIILLVYVDDIVSTRGEETKVKNLNTYLGERL